MPIPVGSPAGLTPAQVNSAETSQWKQIIRQALVDTRCASPAFLVEDMDAAHQTVTAQIAIQERVRTPNGAAWWDVPPIVNVPIMMPRGGGYSITLPLKKGDQGMLIFCDACFDTWWKYGQDNAPPAQNQPPLSGPNPSGSQRQFEVRRHYVHDCGFYPGLWSQNRLLENYSSDSLQIRSDDNTTVIDVSAAGVAVTGSGGTALPLVNDVFYQWYVANIQPFLVSKGYLGPPIPVNSETTILKGQ